MEDVPLWWCALHSYGGWTPRMAFWNTVGTLIGGGAGLLALVVSLVALILVIS